MADPIIVAKQLRQIDLTGLNDGNWHRKARPTPQPSGRRCASATTWPCSTATCGWRDARRFRHSS